MKYLCILNCNFDFLSLIFDIVQDFPARVEQSLVASFLALIGRAELWCGDRGIPLPYPRTTPRWYLRVAFLYG